MARWRRNPKEWGRYSENGYEVSSRGDKRFSALTARLRNGETIEEAWAAAKGYPSIRAAKGKPARGDKFKYWEVYLGLWKKWASENPDLVDELARASKGKVLTDQFAATENNQARALATILNERTGSPARKPKGKVRRMARVERRYVQDHPDILFVFGDNMEGRGLGGQAKAMRGEPNAVGVPTKWKPSRASSAYFSDSDLPQVSDSIDAAFRTLQAQIQRGGDIVVPTAGVGTGLSELPTKAPKIHRYIQEKFAALEGKKRAPARKPVIVHGERPKATQRPKEKTPPKRVSPATAKGSAPSIYAVPVNPLMLSRAAGLISSPESSQILGGKGYSLGVLDPSGLILKRAGIQTIPRAQFERAVVKLKNDMAQSMGQLRLAPQLSKVSWPIVKIGTFKGQPVYLVSTGSLNQYVGLQLTGSPNNVDIKRGLLADWVLLKLALKNAPPSKAGIGLFLPEDVMDEKGRRLFYTDSFVKGLREGLAKAIPRLPAKDKKELAARERKGQVLKVQKIIPAEGFSGVLGTPAGRMAEDRLEHRQKLVNIVSTKPNIHLSRAEISDLADKYDSYQSLTHYLSFTPFQDVFREMQEKHDHRVKGKTFREVFPPLNPDDIALIQASTKEGSNFFTFDSFFADPKEWKKKRSKVMPKVSHSPPSRVDSIPRSSVEKISTALVAQHPGENMWNSPPVLIGLSVNSIGSIPKSGSYIKDIAAGLLEKYDKDENGKLNRLYLNGGEPFVSILAVVKNNAQTRKVPAVRRAEFLPGSETKKLVFISDIGEDKAYVEPVTHTNILRLLNFVHGQRVAADGSFVSKKAPFPFSLDQMAKIPFVKRAVEEEGAKLHDAAMAYLRMVFQPTFLADEVRAGREAQRSFGAEGARGRRGAGGLIAKTPRHVILEMPVAFKRWLPVTTGTINKEGLWPDLLGSRAEIREDMINKALEVYGIGRLTGNRQAKVKKLKRLKKLLEAEQIETDEIQPFVREHHPTEEEDWKKYESFSSKLNPKRGRKPRKARKQRRIRRGRYNPEAEERGAYGQNLADYLKDPTAAGDFVTLEEDTVDWTKTPNLFPTATITQSELSPGFVASRAQSYPLVRFGKRAPVSTIEAIEAREQEGLSREEFADIISGMERSRKSRNKSTIPASSSMCKVYRRQKLPGYRISPALAKAGQPGFQLRKVVLWMAPEGADNRVMMIRRNSHIDCDFVPIGGESTPGQVLSMAIQDVLLWLGQKAKRRKDTFVYVGRVGDPELKLLWRPDNSLDMKSMVANLQLGSSSTMEGYDAEEDEENYYRALERAGFALPPETEKPIFEEEVEEVEEEE